METILLEIINQLQELQAQSLPLDDKLLEKIVRRHNRNLQNNKQHHAKKKLLPYYLKVKDQEPELWASWNISPEVEKQLVSLLRAKPRRTASGVATISVITKPWQCSSNCLYCPGDLQMPKSYLSDEPACQRALMNYFDPYLQVASRLYVLTQMGHVTDKVELIILGGTWSDYPEEYQIWFVSELFRALNDGDKNQQSVEQRRQFYQETPSATKDSIAALQQEVDAGLLSYNQAIKQLYYDNSNHQYIANKQKSDLANLVEQQTFNETAQNRAVGLVIETRPDAITSQSLSLIRRLGCTKIQIGIQSLDPKILAQNNRNISLAKVQEAFELLRIFGFKIHAHFMVNLYGSTPQQDKQEYLRFVTEGPYIPDEVKLYPCALIKGTQLCEHYTNQTWRPYDQEELLDVLITDTLNTPPFIRISRMIRDFSANDILAGNKKANLRQLVESRIEKSGQRIQEIRRREISTGKTDAGVLMLETLGYHTTVSREFFLQWVTLDYRIVGFLRLSLPRQDYIDQHQAVLPVGVSEAMIREVHVYGKVAALHAAGESGQHLGLGKQLIEEACRIAKAQNYTKMNVISSVGTRQYYRGLGFQDDGLYQQMNLV